MIKVESNDYTTYGISICKTILKWFEENNIPLQSDTSLKLVYRPTDVPEFSPYLCTIYINTDDTKWDQFIFQISHEICHYIIFLCNITNYHYISWLEESICEAFSYFWLYKYSVQWNIIGFSKINKNYGKVIHKYLIKELSKKYIEPQLSNDISINILREIDNISQENTGRLQRLNFVKSLYKYTNKNTIESLVNYQKFYKSDILLNTQLYLDTYSNEAIQYICDIQNAINSKNA